MPVEGIYAAALFITGTVLYPALFWGQRKFWTKSKMGQTIAKKYEFNDKDIVDICNKLVSAFQAVLASVSGFLLCGNCMNDVLRDKHDAALGYAWLGIPYFVYDTFCMFYVDRVAKGIPWEYSTKATKEFFRFVLRTPVIVIHHIVMAPIGFSLIVWYRDEAIRGDFFVGILYLMETSTPFVSLRFILSKFRMKSSFLYVINGVCMLVFFPIFRIFSVFYAWVIYSHQLQMSYYEAFTGIQWVWKTCFISALLPQIYWYFLMWKGLIKMLKGKPSTEDRRKRE